MKKDNHNSINTPEVVTQHGGNIYTLLDDKKVAAAEILDFSANINPCAPPPWLRSLINRELELVAHYPDPAAKALIEAITERHPVAAEYIVPANGTTELLHLLPHIIPRGQVIIPVPSYVDYFAVFEKHGFEITPLYLEESNNFAIVPDDISSLLKGKETIIFGNPANPSGSFLQQNSIVELAQNHSDTLFIIDEAFLDFQEDHHSTGGQCENLVTLNSLTKFYGVPGLRLGFGIFPLIYAKKIAALMPQWSINTLAQRVGARALRDHEFDAASRAKFQELSSEMHDELMSIQALKVFPSMANYILLKLVDGSAAETVARELSYKNIMIRCCDNYLGLDKSYFRVAIRKKRENQILLENLKRLLGTKIKKHRAERSKTPALMFQGTSSNAGKSILTAAFCRIFLQDGLRVAPFKSQNMSLNSFVTRDGMEMGRAQVVQAMAARLDPDWRMNPILLKPNSDTGSQVIVNGRPVANMNVKEYHGYKSTAWKSVTRSYDELASQYDCLVLEGAGSPGEINLKKHDIVNMKMAAYAQSPVLLIGDIDRGGVYASFAGTMDVLEEWERAMISGFIVNKFRGDESLLGDAHKFIADHTGRQVIGVVPFITDLSVPQEDSVSMKDGFYQGRDTADSQIEICLIDLPHISNFTDIDSLYYEPDVNIRIVRKNHEIGNPDAIILPGSKNVAGDLRYLKDKGFYECLTQQAENGCVIVGICGGYQMLGKKMADPHMIETTTNEIEGIGLINIDTLLNPDKTLQRKDGIHLPSGLKVSGYEIHHGISASHAEPVLSFSDGSVCGASSYDGRVWGAYLHGVFDEDLFRRWFIDDLRQRKGLSKENRVIAPYNLDESLDELADIVRSCFDMDALYRMIGI